MELLLRTSSTGKCAMPSIYRSSTTKNISSSTSSPTGRDPTTMPGSGRTSSRATVPYQRCAHGALPEQRGPPPGQEDRVHHQALQAKDSVHREHLRHHDKVPHQVSVRPPRLCQESHLHLRNLSVRWRMQDEDNNDDNYDPAFERAAIVEVEEPLHIVCEGG